MKGRGMLSVQKTGHWFTVYTHTHIRSHTIPPPPTLVAQKCLGDSFKHSFEISSFSSKGNSVLDELLSNLNYCNTSLLLYNKSPLEPARSQQFG